ncbi:MAG TPA: ferredoxin [Candidatus Norongarragalinales archaeon]|jgi:ferredoxin|nr:ferredoxin [Candidatus Norongarragalinales archaeon]
MAFRIEHDRPNCIGCAACASINPDFWKMSDEDGKSDVVGSTLEPVTGWEKMDIEEKDYTLNKQAADACPVNVIHLVKKDTGERII